MKKTKEGTRRMNSNENNLYCAYDNFGIKPL